MKKIVTIEGMSCSHCVSHVKEALEEIDGVKVTEVNLETKKAILDTEVKNDILINVIEDEGYEVISIE